MKQPGFRALRLLGGFVVLMLAIAACTTTPPQPEQATLTVTVDGTGTGTVTSEPTGIDLTTGDDPDTLTVDVGTEITLTAEAAAGSFFAGWSGDCSGTDPCVLPMDADTNVTATFTLLPLGPQTMTVDKVGNGDGSVTSAPAGIALAIGEVSDTFDFDSGTEVTLTAEAAAGSFFAGWSGDCSGLGSCVVTMDAARNVTAEFALNTDVTTTEFVIAQSSDDAEQYKGVTPFGPIGSVDIGSGRLDLGQHPTLDVEVIVGLRFAGISIPQGAVITSATILFERDTSSGTEPITLTIEGQAADDAPTFLVANTAGDPNMFGISSRATLATSVQWPNETAWGTTATTPDLAALVQQIVNRAGWQEANAMAFIISSDDPNVSPDNWRGARSFDNSRADSAPKLSVSYYVPTAP